MASAARQLGCTSAQVSKQIAELERAFAARLFERSTCRLILTAAGDVFHRHALHALEAARGTEIAAAQPEFECELILTDDIIDLVADNIDLALRMTRQPPEDAVARRIVSLRRVTCAAPHYLARHGVRGAPHDLVRHQCLSYVLRDDKVWSLLDARGNETRVPVTSRIHFNNIECILDAALAGHGLAILPTFLCHRELANGTLRTVLDGYEPNVIFGRDLYACYTPSRVRVPKVKVFLDALARHFQPQPRWEREAG